MRPSSVVKFCAALTVCVLAGMGTAGAQEAGREVRDYVSPPEIDPLDGIDPLGGLEIETLKRRVGSLEAENERLRVMVHELDERVKRLEDKRK